MKKELQKGQTKVGTTADLLAFILILIVDLFVLLAALGVVFQENLVLYRTCGDRLQADRCFDAGTPISLVVVILGGVLVLIAATSYGIRSRSKGGFGFWFALAGLAAIAALTGLGVATVALSTR